ncbi:MAG: glycosyltransferase family 2 protein [Aquificae bacterium]|nr:glycosyltransferase family 2 protein [Aquificota bacterium]
MKKLSVLIATKNAEDTIERAINSIKEIADEIIVVDSGSTDKTLEIAEKLGAKIFFKEWENYGVQQNFLIDKSTGDFCFVLDSDEEVSPELRNSIKEVLKKDQTADCYEVNRKTYYMGKFLNHVWQPEWRIRLFKKGKVRFQERVHAKAICNGTKERLKGDLYHYSYKNLKHHFQKTIYFAEETANLMYKNKKKFRFYNLILNPLIYFTKFYFLKKGFLDGYRGFIVSVVGAVYGFFKYAFLFEKYQKEKYGENLWKRKK